MAVVRRTTKAAHVIGYRKLQAQPGQTVHSCDDETVGTYQSKNKTPSKEDTAAGRLSGAVGDGMR